MDAKSMWNTLTLATKRCPLDGCPMFAIPRTWVEYDLFPMLLKPVAWYL
jgi:hypothetical protein